LNRKGAETALLRLPVSRVSWTPHGPAAAWKVANVERGRVDTRFSAGQRSQDMRRSWLSGVARTETLPLSHAHWLQVTARRTAYVTRRTHALSAVSQIIVSRHERQHRTIPVARRDFVAKRAVASLGPPLSFSGVCQKPPHTHARPSHHTHGLLRRHVEPSLLLVQPARRRWPSPPPPRRGR